MDLEGTDIKKKRKQLLNNKHHRTCTWTRYTKSPSIQENTVSARLQITYNKMLGGCNIYVKTLVWRRESIHFYIKWGGNRKNDLLINYLNNNPIYGAPNIFFNSKTQTPSWEIGDPLILSHKGIQVMEIPIIGFYSMDHTPIKNYLSSLTQKNSLLKNRPFPEETYEYRGESQNDSLWKCR